MFYFLNCNLIVYSACVYAREKNHIMIIVVCSFHSSDIDIYMHSWRQYQIDTCCSYDWNYQAFTSCI